MNQTTRCIVARGAKSGQSKKAKRVRDELPHRRIPLSGGILRAAKRVVYPGALSLADCFALVSASRNSDMRRATFCLPCCRAAHGRVRPCKCRNRRGECKRVDAAGPQIPNTPSSDLRRGSDRTVGESVPSQAEADTFNRRPLTRFGIDTNQFGASSCHKARPPDDRRQLFAYAGVDGDWNLRILTRSRGSRLLGSDGSAADRPQRCPPAPALR